MFNLNDKDYTEHVQAKMRRQAAQARLAQDVTETGTEVDFFADHRRLVKGLVVLFVLLIIWTAYQNYWAADRPALPGTVPAIPAWA